MITTVLLSNSRAPTRRGLVQRAIAGAASIGFGLAAGRAAAAAKLAQAEIGYQPTPKGRLRCDMCANWQGPNACKVVAGAISPMGWCGLFVARR